MDWRLKAAAQAVCSTAPGGARLHRFLQERVSQSLPAGPERMAEVLAAAEDHLAAVLRVSGATDAGALDGYEFGAGWQLGVPVACALLGVGRQTSVDRFRLADDGLLRHSVGQLAAMVEPTGRTTDAVRATSGLEALDVLGIEYLAPVDAAATGLPTSSFDFVMSTSTLEHVRADEIRPLLEECHRLLRPGGVMSMMIDYKDHYAAFDPRCPPFNFLRYDERRWARYSPSFHFQNRLRHSDHVALIEVAGFEILEVHTVDATEEDLQWLGVNRIDPAFDRYEPGDLLMRDAHVVARRPGGSGGRSW